MHFIRTRNKSIIKDSNGWLNSITRKLETIILFFRNLRLLPHGKRNSIIRQDYDICPQNTSYIQIYPPFEIYSSIKDCVVFSWRRMTLFVIVFAPDWVAMLWLAWDDSPHKKKKKKKTWIPWLPIHATILLSHLFYDQSQVSGMHDISWERN